jgi:hypothetical protein
MKPLRFALIVPLLAACQPGSAPSADPPASGSLTLHRTATGSWEFHRDGEPFFIRGAGGQSHLDVLAASGGNMIRTWGIDNLTEEQGGRTLVERARSHGLLITAGLWVGHERHGFDYGDPAQIQAQREEIREAVARWKDEPSIAIWGLGNEMEGPTQDGRDVRIWKELEALARIIREEDPGRPIMTVIAGAGAAKVQGIKVHCPSIDILGVNAYAPAAGAGKAVKEAGWDKAFMLTEFGPLGHWEVPATSWGAPIEPGSRAKAAKYEDTQQRVVRESQGLCVGTFAFFWGQKQECTATWYGMFLESGEKLPAVDAMAHAWTREWPANRCPQVETFTSPAGGQAVEPNQQIEVQLTVSDPDGDPLALEWRVAPESTDRRIGGDKEAAPPEFTVTMNALDDGRWTFRAPAEPGPYRLFLIARDGKGAASTENFPFLVR